MKKTYIALLSIVLACTSCTDYNALLKTQDYEYKYEAAKQAYAAGRYSQCYQLLDDMLLMFKGTEKGEESLMMMAMCHYRLHDYETSTLYFDRYVKTYPKGLYAELCRYYSGRASYLQSPDPRLDQSPTYTAIKSLQEFLEYYPYSERRNDVNNMIFELQDRLVVKEYESARLYYNLGNYVGNCINGGSNYEACIITAENAVKDYPYTGLRENLYWLILRSRYQLAQNSVLEKAEERYRQTIDEYYGFKNEFPDSKYMEAAGRIFKHANNRLNKVVVTEEEQKELEQLKSDETLTASERRSAKRAAKALAKKNKAEAAKEDKQVDDVLKSENESSKTAE